jgi:hypothetical protein
MHNHCPAGFKIIGLLKQAETPAKDSVWYPWKQASIVLF